MAIRVPDLGTGSGAVGDGDNELKIRQDYNHNFNDQTNAASRLVGTEAGQVPLAENTYTAALGSYIPFIAANTSFNFNDILQGTRVLVSVDGNLNAPPITGDTLVYVECIMTAAGSAAAMQKAYGYTTGAEFTRVKLNGTYQAWKRTVRTEADGGISLPYTQAGIGAPKTAQKLLTATYTASNFLIPMGISITRILSVSVTVTAPSGEVIPYGYNVAGLKFYYFASGTNISMRTTGEDNLLVGGIVKVFISYEV